MNSKCIKLVKEFESKTKEEQDIFKEKILRMYEDERESLSKLHVEFCEKYLLNVEEYSEPLNDENDNDKTKSPTIRRNDISYHDEMLTTSRLKAKLDETALKGGWYKAPRGIEYYIFKEAVTLDGKPLTYEQAIKLYGLYNYLNNHTLTVLDKDGNKLPEMSEYDEFQHLSCSHSIETIMSAFNIKKKNVIVDQMKLLIHNGLVIRKVHKQKGKKPQYFYYVMLEPNIKLCRECSDNELACNFHKSTQ